jgi:hypothetical protein
MAEDVPDVRIARRRGAGLLGTYLSSFHLLPLFSSPFRRFAPFAHSIVSRCRIAAARAPPSPLRRRLRSQHPIHHCASLDVLTNLWYARTAHRALDHRPARPVRHWP